MKFYLKKVRYRIRKSLPWRMEHLMNQVPQFNLKNRPKVSIIMPSYNRSEVIIDAIQSVLRQKYKNYELLIVDDGSNDGTEDLIRTEFGHLLDDKIFYFRIEKGGVSKARNFGLQKAQGEYIAYLDTDNQWRPHFLGTMLHLLQTSFSKCAYCALEVENEVDQMVFSLYESSFDWDSLYKRNYIDLNGFVHHKTLYHEIGGFDEELTRLVDWDLILRYTDKYEPLPIPYIMVDYRVSADLEHVTTLENYENNRRKISAKYPSQD